MALQSGPLVAPFSLGRRKGRLRQRACKMVPSAPHDRDSLVTTISFRCDSALRIVDIPDHSGKLEGNYILDFPVVSRYIYGVN